MNNFLKTNKNNSKDKDKDKDSMEVIAIVR